MKFLPIVVTVVLVLGGCARGGPQGSGADSSTRSNVEFYGTLDAGVGVQDFSR
ncbi:MAG TPA: hypothetical protein VNQ97_12990 [Burkholderiaceae bacterium]|nr:hypothetical protein [Burkholderiaceae bacterium]